MIFSIFVVLLLLLFSREIEAQQNEETRWVSNVIDVSSFSSAGQNAAHDVAIDRENNTIAVGTFDSVIKIGKFQLSTDYPAVFVCKTSPKGEVLWAIQV